MTSYIDRVEKVDLFLFFSKIKKKKNIKKVENTPPKSPTYKTPFLFSTQSYFFYGDDTAPRNRRRQYSKHRLLTTVNGSLSGRSLIPHIRKEVY